MPWTPNTSGNSSRSKPTKINGTMLSNSEKKLSGLDTRSKKTSSMPTMPTRTLRKKYTGTSTTLITGLN
jgi:hypothetical protein